ncbi:hypothetical protein CTAM01_14322 [Colletotrichum tamarilloi]|uniref:Uncharacterized protein n=1 Tax=Colletotrichum tamarilloi TaxID=1209934 RepID=A0ABQ9QPT8_9PEZI|nr:uncharacterized protein CTAM01_14322 [Colletotrichum tamarilloi]KAK1480571.1 hypothetical protein CTAM01_14322 [Colletotrichum tamarilloi]
MAGVFRPCGQDKKVHNPFQNNSNICRHTAISVEALVVTTTGLTIPASLTALLTSPAAHIDNNKRLRPLPLLLAFSFTLGFAVSFSLFMVGILAASIDAVGLRVLDLAVATGAAFRHGCGLVL